MHHYNHKFDVSNENLFSHLIMIHRPDRPYGLDYTGLAAPRAERIPDYFAYILEVKYEHTEYKYVNTEY